VQRLVIFKQVWEAPRPERAVAPYDKVRALIDLSDGHSAATLHVQIVDVEAEVMNDFVLRLAFVQAWINSLCLEQATKEDRLVGFDQLFVVPELRLLVVTPDKKALLGRKRT